MTMLAPMDGLTPQRLPNAVGANDRPIRSTRCGPSETIACPWPGDVILVHGSNWVCKFIGFFQRRRYRTQADRAFAYWSHAALIVTSTGLVIEGTPTGVIIGSIEKYRALDYQYIHVDLPGSQRSEAVLFAHSCRRQKYGVLGFVLLGVALLLRDRVRVPDLGQQGCAALVVRALRHAGMTFERGPAEMTPADLAKQFGVTP
jgi:hypothetical protein